MNPRILDAIGVIGRFVSDHWNETLIGKEDIFEELLDLGFSDTEIDNAFRWIEENTLGNENAGKKPNFKCLPPVRVLSPVEASKIHETAWGRLLSYYHRGLIESDLLEDIIARAVHGGSEEVQAKEIKQITALALFNKMHDDWSHLLNGYNTKVH